MKSCSNRLGYITPPHNAAPLLTLLKATGYVPADATLEFDGDKAVILTREIDDE